MINSSKQSRYRFSTTGLSLYSILAAFSIITRASSCVYFVFITNVIGYLFNFRISKSIF